MSVVFNDLYDAIGLTATFIPFHQGIIELWKLFGSRTRRYWEALNYIVYGTENGFDDNEELKRSASDILKGFVVGIPTTFPKRIRDHYKKSGKQTRLIQSFLLRSVGDSPITEVSDADIRNVSDISKLMAPLGVQQTATALDELIRLNIRNPNDAQNILDAVLTTLDDHKDKILKNTLRNWINILSTEGQDVSPALFYVWRVQFIESFLPGVIRAERELANALKSAEFRYHRQLRSFSAFLAFIEAISINFVFIASCSFYTQIIGFLFGFGALTLGSEAGKSLLQTIVGIGARFRR
ncbi:hypothetical protein ACQE3E_07920 [Methylomonas sp. MED-D]|uniref:hypothetical protein n=1 Tax=unclassified Methylomonas TaxID=2608980 RepID=UPI0028A3E3AF|nr:hypothetical protein [Methylomonas sp. MV1]MDT4329160.1 hypothetical protein [Methylomonas sp. MV1]